MFDLETDGLQYTKIFCCVVKNLQTQQVWRFVNDDSASIYHELKKFFDEAARHGGVFVAHNGISFDWPCLQKLAGTEISFEQVVDTLVLSFLYNPALIGGHSLEAYGERLKFPKVTHADWSKFTPEMLHRCETDVDLLEKVYLALLDRMNRIGFSEQSAEIEHHTRRIIDGQQAHGFWFDKARAEDLYNHLRGREADLSVPIQKLFPARLTELGTYTRRFRQDGSDFASYLRHVERYPQVTHNGDGTYTCWDWSDFNVGSPQQRLERLLELGYEPTARTPKGNPKVDEDSLVAFAKSSGLSAVQAMADWLVCNGRANMILTWLNHVGPDSRIHGKVLTCGATTRRMTHSAPNTANIPSASKAAYGHECRALWCVEPGKGLKEVGADASGLETVGLLHYLGNKRAEAILTQPKPNDVHSMNARALTQKLGREIDREWGSKTSWYAWLYGAFSKKLGEIVKGPPSDGQTVIDTFFGNVPGLKRLIDDVQSEFFHNDGLLRTVDGGFVRCPSENAALNYRIQSLGAVVMKKAAMILDGWRDFEWYFLGTIHDEWQMETAEGNAEELGRLATKAISQAAEELNFKVPLKGDFKVGDNWSMTH